MPCSCRCYRRVCGWCEGNANVSAIIGGGGEAARSDWMQKRGDAGGDAWWRGAMDVPHCAGPAQGWGRGAVRDGCERRCGVCGAGDAGIPGGFRGESLWRGQGLRRGQGRFQILSRDAVIPAGMGARMTSSRRQRHEVWPRRLAWSRTLPFHGSDMGSNPIGVTSLAFAGVFCFSTESHAAPISPTRFELM